MQKFIATILCIIFLASSAAGLVHAQATDIFLVTTEIVPDDPIPPSVPTLTATALSQSEIELSWTSSTDNIAVGGYQLFRDGTPIATTTAGTTAYIDNGLATSTTYAYTVRAFDTTGNYSAHSATSTATTFGPPPPGSTPVEAPSHSALLTFESLIVTPTPGIDRIMLKLESRVHFTADVAWAEPGGPVLGTLSAGPLKPEHLLFLTGLKSGTTYLITVVARDSVGQTVSKTVSTVTLGGPDRDPPANPSRFVATPQENGIALSWKNPADPDFDVVRIMRIPNTIPTDPYDGTPIYEGSLEYFLDTTASPGIAYGYTIFARDASGNYSSGAVAYVRMHPGEGIDDTGIVTPSNVESYAVSPLFPALSVVQDGKFLSPSRGIYSLRTDLPFGIALDAAALPKVLKTILVTLRDPEDPKKSFSFLLRINHTGTHYVAKIGALDRTGDYPTVISVMDFDANTLEAMGFTIRATMADEPVAAPTESVITPHALAIPTLFLLFILLVLLFLWWLLSRRRRKEEQTEVAPA